jgi:chromate transporter
MPPTDRPAPWLRRIWDLTASFTRVGLFGFGGGPSFIPLIEREVVGRRWLDRPVFLDAFAFGNTLPGPIATKLAGYVGYRVAGAFGMITALLALTLPSIVAMIALAEAYAANQDALAVQGFLRGLRPVVIALLLQVVLEFAPGALGPVASWRAHLASWAIFAGAFALAIAGVHPGLLILAGGALGLALRRA